ncbi:MAG: potassium channel protein [Deltaproteobacteria bacterium]|nr:potassium channel protein [Deltaproteobacteria bacterium]
MNFERIRPQLTSFFRTLRRELVLHLFFGVIGLLCLGTLGFFISETHIDPWETRLWKAAWWALVTLTTVGYGDVVPVTGAGRLVGAGLMFGGLLMLSLLTATIASVFVERKFRRERGLEAVKMEQHILILGWNHDGVVFLDQLMRRLSGGVPVVLVNQLPAEQLENLRAKYPDHEVAYIWGDFSREDILLKANVRRAVKAVILGGRQAGETAAQVDQRILLTALTLKSLNPKLRILAELHLPENRLYLERAGVEEVMIRGQYDSSLMAGAIAAPGLFRLMTSLLTVEGPDLWAVEIPPRFHGHQVKELAQYLKEKHQALLIGLYSEGRALSLEDLLSEEPSAIDDFIRRKFEATGMTHLFGRAKVDVQVNPPDEQILTPRQQAVVIASARPFL